MRPPQVGSLTAVGSSGISTCRGRGAGGDTNRVVFVKRREGGGCDGLQMQAFYDTSRPAGPDATGYLGFGTIPGDVCAAGEPGEAAATPQP